MKADKVRNLTDPELQHQERELNDQLFRLKFQLKMGQTESLTKIRGLRKDVARVHTVIREKELGIAAPSNGHKTEAAAGDAEPKPSSKKAAAGKSAKKKKTKAAAKGKTAKPAKKKTAAKARKK